MLRRFAVSQQAQTSFKGRLKRPKQGLEAETSTAAAPAPAEAGLKGQVTWCGCAREKRGKGRGLRLRSSRQSVSAQTGPAEDGGMEPPQDAAKVSNTEDNHNRRVHSLYAAPLFQRISQTHLENMQERGSEFASTAWNVQEQDKPSNLPKVEFKEGPGYRLLNVSGGLAGGVCPLSPERVRQDQGVRVPVGGRETCPRLESVSPEGEFSCGPLTVA